MYSKHLSTGPTKIMTVIVRNNRTISVCKVFSFLINCIFLQTYIKFSELDSSMVLLFRKVFLNAGI